MLNVLVIYWSFGCVGALYGLMITGRSVQVVVYTVNVIGYVLLSPSNCCLEDTPKFVRWSLCSVAWLY